jgi:CubicO group peptidase (beta-lactamase class C family)
MSTGLECRDSYKYQWQGLTEMMSSDDWVGHFLSLPMTESPGTRFEYCNGATFLLSEILYETTSVTPQEFARLNLFEPLGIEVVEWNTSPEGISLGFTGLYLQPQDMAKFGYLYLHGGVWQGEQIIPAWYVEQATQAQIAADIEEGYGYQWWVDEGGMFVALGYHGQFIYVIPELDMVVVFLSDSEIGKFESPYTLLERYILPAVISDEALPENLQGRVDLEANLEQLSKP